MKRRFADFVPSERSTTERSTQTIAFARPARRCIGRRLLTPRLWLLRCAYFWYFVLLLGGAACLVGWYVKSAGCIKMTEDCLVQYNVTSDGLFEGFDPKVPQASPSTLAQPKPAHCLPVNGA